MVKVIELSKGEFALIDDEDYARVAAFNWWYISSPSWKYSGYAIGYVHKEKVRMHRFIMNAPEGIEVDHINHDGLDNRKENLRLATRTENARNNRKKPSASKYKGITESARKKGRWRAQIRISENQNTNLGTFDNELLAALAYDYHARKYHGEFAQTNFTDEVFDALWEIHGKEVLDPKHRKGTSSKYVGVYWSARDHCWRAQVAYQKKVYPVGTFKTEEEAHIGREEFKAKLLDTV